MINEQLRSTLLLLANKVTALSNRVNAVDSALAQIPVTSEETDPVFTVTEQKVQLLTERSLQLIS